MSLSFQPTTSPLFLKLGKIINAAKTLDIVHATTVPTEVEDILDQYASGSMELQTIPAPLRDATDVWKGGGDSLLLSLREVFRDTIIRYVKEDEQQPTDTLEDALAELIRQLEETNTYVEYIAPTAAVATVGTVVDNRTITVSMLNRHGLPIPFAYDEIIDVECTDERTSGAEVLRFRGEPSVSKFANDWPQGSGLDVTRTAIGPTDRRNLVTNGSFETVDDDDSTLPDGWLEGDGTSAALTTIPDIEVQTLTTTGTPTGGYYYLEWTHGTIKQRTDSLAYNASGNAVQAALRSLRGLGAVTVSTTGTSPDFTHTITFVGVSGPAQLVAEDAGLTGGSTPAVTPATTTTGLTSQYGARHVRMTSNGSESGAMLYQKLTGLTAETAYAVAVGHLLADNVSVTQGTLAIRLVDAIGGNTISDKQGTANEITLLHSSMSSGWLTATGFFRTPKELPDTVYLAIEIDSAFDNTNVVRIDGIRIVEAEELYDGGPLAVVFAATPAIGSEAETNFVLGNKFTLAVTNAYTAELQHNFNRFCDLDALDVQLPSASGVSSSTNEVQTLTITGTPIGGTFTISYDGQTTGTIAYDAAASAVQTALEGLSNIESGEVSCGGGALPGTPVTITFQGNLAGRNVSLMTADGSGLTGGSTPDATIALTTPGVGYLSDSVFIS